MITFILLIFVIGYTAIATEHTIRINKAASALLTGVLCWTFYVFSQTEVHPIQGELTEYVGEISGILFFLMGAMTIVELIDAHDGFEIITERIVTKSLVKLLWLLGFVSFFLSAILDNLTTTIVMVSLLRKLMPKGEMRLLFASVIVIAANAGGAWTPIGDVTTTMLWIGGQITTIPTITHLLLPSLVCMVIPLGLISLQLKGNVQPMPVLTSEKLQTPAWERKVVFSVGVLSLVFVPVFKSITHLPPYMGILGALGMMWMLTELIHYRKEERDKDRFSVLYALRMIDMPTILFFLGILLAIAALQQAGILISLSQWLEQHVSNVNVVVIIIGFLSAIIDNVPLVAAAMGMYDLNQYPVDHYFWQFLAYSAGTGGSMLIIGSAAGVAAMGIEKINFFWYLKKVAWLAAIGFLAGAVVFMLQYSFFA